MLVSAARSVTDYFRSCALCELSVQLRTHASCSAKAAVMTDGQEGASALLARYLFLSITKKVQVQWGVQRLQQLSRET